MADPDRGPGSPFDGVELAWRGPFEDPELNTLHAEAFGHPVTETPWRRRTEERSLGWVTARAGGLLVGFVNVLGDGGEHAILLDTCVAAPFRHRGVGERLVRTAADEARAAGCAWLHVDFTDELSPFYLEACSFRATPAGLLALQADHLPWRAPTHRRSRPSAGRRCDADDRTGFCIEGCVEEIVLIHYCINTECRRRHTHRSSARRARPTEIP